MKVKLIDRIIPNKFSKYFRRWTYDQRFRKKFKELHGYELNEDSPCTFPEKMFYRKKYGNFDKMAQYSDKFSVREFVKNRIGNEYLIPILGHYSKLTLEDFNELPNKFVVKTTHGSGKKHIEIVRNKETHDLNSLIKKMNHALELDFGYARRELWYTKIPKKIVIEAFLESEKDSPDDYKFHCFSNGDVIFVAVDEGRFSEHCRSVYDSDWRLTNIQLNVFNPIGQKDKPENFEKMKMIVKQLSAGFDYIRIDLYSVNGQIYFGEFTHCPANGMEVIKPLSVANEWGELWEIDSFNKNLYTSSPDNG